MSLENFESQVSHSHDNIEIKKTSFRVLKNALILISSRKQTLI